MIKKYSELVLAFTQDDNYLQAIANKDTKSLGKMVRQSASSQGYTLGPVWHGTVYSFQGHVFKGDMQFFSETAEFARNYAQQKSQESQMDADITVRSFFLLGKVFDPKNPEHIKRLSPFLPEKIETTSSWGFGNTLSKDEWLAGLSGVGVNPSKFSESDLKNKKPGDPLPDNEVFNKPMKFEFIGLDANDVVYANAGTINSILTPRFPSWMREEQKIKFTRSEIIEDLIKASKFKGWSLPDWFRKKYSKILMENKHISVYRTSKYPVKYEGFDTWGDFEGDPEIISALIKSGFRIIKMQEKGKVTYATLSPNQIKLADPITYNDQKEIIPLSKRFNPAIKDFRY